MKVRPSTQAGWSTFVIPSVLLVLCSTYAATVDAQTTLIDLGTLGGSQSSGTGINDAGQIVGYSTLAGDTVNNAFIYNNGVMTDLGTLGGASGSSQAWGINSSGQVVGQSSTAIGTSNAFLYTNGVMQNIAPSSAGPIPGDYLSYAYALNDSGTVTGVVQPSPSCSVSCTAFLYSNGTLTNLGLSAFSKPSAINGAGLIVGTYLSSNIAATPQAFVYNNGTVQYLTSATTPSYANGINVFGQVVGSVTLPGQTVSEAALFSNGSVQGLGTLTAGESSTARAINASGEIVGDGFFGVHDVDHAFLYADGHMADLNSLDTSSPLATYVTLTQATAINDNGWIVADGVDSRTGLEHAYLVENPASPVPLPGALWLMLSGICGLGAYARRRKGLST